MMTEYRMPDEPDGPVWDRYKDPWVKSYVHFGKWVPGTAPYAVVDEGIPATWDDLLCDLGPLTTTPPIKEGDTGLTAEQVWDLPKGTVIWPERDPVPEPWLRFSNRWESISDVSYDAGELQRAVGNSFRVLILGGEK